MGKIKVGILGAAGYTAGELIRVLLRHPEVVLGTLQSTSQAGKLISNLHTDLIGESELRFSASLQPQEHDVVFLCKGHGESVNLIKEQPELLKTKIIDLSNDFRLTGTHEFVYGLPESNRSAIQQAKYIANPGCFATAIQLSLLPAVASDLIGPDVHISGITGSTGAGQEFSLTSHFSWRSGNAGVYKPFEHQHLAEIGENLNRTNANFDTALHFIPYRGAFARGIITTAYFEAEISSEGVKEIYQRAYAEHPFTIVTNQNPDIKSVVNTNKCLVYPVKIGKNVMVIAVIDNLLKGAAGQAIQNMNLMFGLDETCGLKLKGSAF